jgi:uncharacterized membrane protein
MVIIIGIKVVIGNSILLFQQHAIQLRNSYFLILYLILREDKRLLTSKTPTEVKIEKTPREILDERYAKGELSREQYLQMKEDINKPDT